MDCDLLVIGAGPGGYPAAFHAAEAGLKVALVDPEADPGGVCLYRGCVPSKALLHVARFLHEIEQAPEWGITVQPPAIDLDKLRKWKQSVVEGLTRGAGQLVRQRHIAYHRGTARLLDSHHARLALQDGQTRELAFGQAIIATGSAPVLLPGLPPSNRIMTSSQALDIERIPPRLLVVGGGYIGVELGQVYAALGSKVTVAEMLPQLLAGTDRDLVRFLESRLKKTFEAVLTDTKVREVRESGEGLRVAFEGKGTGEALFDGILLAVGRKPVTRDIGLESTGVTVNQKGFIEVDGQRRTADKALFAVGDVAGEPMLAHKAMHEGRVAADAAAGKSTVFDPRAIPFVVFSDPEIAWCGLSQGEAERRGLKIKVTAFPWSASGRAATLSRKDGLTKLISDPQTGRLLGAGIAGQGAGEMLAEAVLGMELGAVADDLALTIHTHPTLSETLMEAAQAFSGSSTHYQNITNR